MDTMSPIIVKKGFLSTVAQGLFGTLITAIVCGSGLGFYLVNIVDRKTGDLFSFTQETIASLPALRAALPPAIADALADRRDPAYRQQLDVAAQLVAGEQSDDVWSRRVVLNVTNKGDQTVSLLAVRLVLLDAQGVPVRAVLRHAATPIALEDEQWNGPLMPGGVRKIPVIIPTDDKYASVSAEVTDLRIWTGQEATTSAPRADVATPGESAGRG
ncbi:MAG: hypothetical protein CHACPFDD_02350 [Phycisphaerae bacterium]|nr:hypothetical protein [Phycisphaerae bacterium]